MPFSGRSQSCWEGDSTNIRQKSSRGISYFPWQHGNIIWLWKLKLCRDLLLFFFNSASLELLFSHSSVSDFLRPLALKHARLPCPSLSPGVCSNSYPWCWWCHPTITFSVTPFSSWIWFRFWLYFCWYAYQNLGGLVRVCPIDPALSTEAVGWHLSLYVNSLSHRTVVAT